MGSAKSSQWNHLKNIGWNLLWIHYILCLPVMSLCSPTFMTDSFGSAGQILFDLKLHLWLQWIKQSQKCARQTVALSINVFAVSQVSNVCTEHLKDALLQWRIHWQRTTLSQRFVQSLTKLGIQVECSNPRHRTGKVNCSMHIQQLKCFTKENHGLK